MDSIISAADMAIVGLCFIEADSNKKLKVAELMQTVGLRLPKTKGMKFFCCSVTGKSTRILK